MTDIAVSVIIPVYNAEKYLEQCLDSLINQTLENIEIIIVNDGSTDSTQEIIDRYVKKYQNIRSVYQENKGVVSARCHGLQLAKGQYIGWVDSDDFVEKNMFERMYQAARSNNADVVSCDYSFYPHKIATKEKWFKKYQGQVDWNFIERNTQLWNKIVRRSYLEEVDMLHWLGYCGEGAYALLYLRSDKIISLTDPLYFYRVGHSSISSTYKTNSYEENIQKTVRQWEMVEENGLCGKWNDYFQYRIIYAVLLAMLVAAYDGEKERYQAYRKQLKDLHWKSNKFTKTILTNNHGKLKRKSRGIGICE